MSPPAGPPPLPARATDSLGHGIATWAWDDGGVGGKFSDVAAQSPTYTPPENLTESDVTVTLTLTATCDDATSPITDHGSCPLIVHPTFSRMYINGVDAVGYHTNANPWPRRDDGASLSLMDLAQYWSTQKYWARVVVTPNDVAPALDSPLACPYTIPAVRRRRRPAHRREHLRFQQHPGHTMVEQLLRKRDIRAARPGH